jgi:hypothetical protein
MLKHSDGSNQHLLALWTADKSGNLAGHFYLLLWGNQDFFRAPRNRKVFRSYQDPLPLLHVLAVCTGDALNQSPSWRPAQPPLGARAPNRYTSPASHILAQLAPPLPPFIFTLLPDFAQQRYNVTFPSCTAVQRGRRSRPC